MRKLTGIALLLIAGGFFVLKNFDIEGLEQLKLRPKGAEETSTGANDGPPPVTRAEKTIRVGTFNIQVFGSHKLSKPGVMNLLADVARRFDILAIQEVRATSNDILPRFVDLINSTGRHYDFIIGPRLGRTSSKEQYAFIFDTASIETDRSSAYTVEDPDDQLHREPLVGWFRVRGPRANEAFTFTLVNVHTDPDDVPREMNALALAYRAIRDDGRREDDTIMLGDFNDWIWRGSVQNAIHRALPRRTWHRTFPSWCPLIRLDRIYCRPASAMLRSWTDGAARVASDHLPVFSEIALGP